MNELKTLASPRRRPESSTVWRDKIRRRVLDTGLRRYDDYFCWESARSS